MCFSAEADLVAGIVVGAVGVDAVRHVRRPGQRWLAALPLVFATHQLTEAVVWWGLHDQVAASVWQPARWVYLSVAFGLIPVLVPVAVGANEPDWNRRRTGVFVALGAAVAVVLMYAVVRGPVSAEIEGRHISYEVELWHGGAIVGLYVIATCGSLLISAHPHVRWYGGINLVAVGLLAWFDRTAFISLWCAWAAITSVAIAAHLRAESAAPRPASPSRDDRGRAVAGQTDGTKTRRISGS